MSDFIPTIKVVDYDGRIFLNTEILDYTDIDDYFRIAVMIPFLDIDEWPTEYELLIFSLDTEEFGYVGSGRLKKASLMEDGIILIIKLEHEYDKN